MKHLHLILATIFILFSTIEISQAQVKDKVIAGMSLDRLGRYENYVKREVSAGKIPGAVLLIARNGQSVYNSAIGISHSNGRREMKTDDIFYIQSMTKPIITAAFMILFEEGHFLLTDPLSKYLPAAKNLLVLKNQDEGINGGTVPLKREIIIADLLSHTAGFSHGIGQTKYEKDVYSILSKPHKTIQERVDEILSIPLLGQPGEQWAYSITPDVLSVIIEKISGQSTAQFLSDRIFKPLGMKNTGYNLTKEQQKRVVQVQGADPGGLLTTQPKMEGNTVWSGVNGLYSTADDYMAFCQMLLNEGRWNGKQVLSRKTIELMTLNHSGDLFGFKGEGFGYGFAIVNNLSATDNLGSDGIYYWAGAFNTHFLIDKKEKLISIFLTQNNAFDWYFHNKMRQLVYQALIE